MADRATVPEPSSDPIERRLFADSFAVDQTGAPTIGGLRLDDLAREYGTPLFVYCEDTLRSRARAAAEAFGGDNVVFATKAFLCRAMARLAFEEGLLLDVASGGELHVALAAGVPADRCVMHGNNKSRDELRMALIAGVRRIVVDSFDELDRLDSICHEAGVNAAVQLRITPGVKATTHDFIATGQDDSKFGFNVANGDAMRAVERCRASAHLDLKGIHAHVGSQVFSADNFAKLASALASFSEPLGLDELVLGGGLGVPYVSGEEAPSIEQWAAVLLAECRRIGIRSSVMVEPGRALVARAGMTLYEVGTVKHIPGVRTYVSVDGGMSDNPRPQLYGSGYEVFLVREPMADRTMACRLVGKHCESGDVLIFDARLPEHTRVGDFVGTPVTGAYGHSMASNYNKLTRPPVVFVRNGEARLVVRRETYDDLLSCDLG
jgi:diaminopimelate decarboxylase